MKIAYLILAHKNPDQIIRLINRLNTPENFFIIHYDKKANISDKIRIKNNFINNRNIYILENNIKAYWGDYSILNAQIILLKKLFELKLNFDYLIYLSGQCYPIKSNNYINKFLIKRNKISFIEWNLVKKENVHPRIIKRLENWHHIKNKKQKIFPPKIFQPFIKRKFIKNFKPYKGGNWFALTKNHSEYFLNLTNKNKNLINYFKYVSNPEEFAFHTIFLNSPHKNNIINDSLHYIDWSNFNAPRPALFKSSDFNNLKNSNKLFARKFDPDIDSEILDRIDKELLF